MPPELETIRAAGYVVAVCEEERCVTSLKTAARDYRIRERIKIQVWKRCMAWVFFLAMEKALELLTLTVHVTKMASQDCLFIHLSGISETGESVVKIA